MTVKRGGIYERDFIVNANTARPLLTIDLTRSTVVALRDAPTILLQADGKSALMRAIESSVFDETTTIVAAYPGEKVLIIDPLGKGPKLEALKAVVEQGTELFSAWGCCRLQYLFGADIDS